MVKCLSFNCNTLTFNKKVLLTFLLVLFSIGSYTYSEITTDPSSKNETTHLNLTYQKSTISEFSIYYITPVLNTKPNSKKAIFETVHSESIMSNGNITSSTLAMFLQNNNQNIEDKYAHALAKLYIEEANHEGVNPEIAFTQMCLETGFLRFDGTVDKHQNNFCGLGATGNGVKGLSFKDYQQGVRAHIQHLKAYASTHELKNELIDDRFKYVKRGSVTQLSGLTGKWAMDVNYDIKIRNLLTRLYKLDQ